MNPNIFELPKSKIAHKNKINICTGSEKQITYVFEQPKFSHIHYFLNTTNLLIK